MLRSAAVLAQELGQLRHRGLHAQRVPRLHAAALRAVGVPIYAFTDDEALFRQLLLPWGVEPFLMPFSDDPEKTIPTRWPTSSGGIGAQKGTWLVVITNVLRTTRVIDTLQPARSIGGLPLGGGGGDLDGLPSRENAVIAVPSAGEPHSMAWRIGQVIGLPDWGFPG